MLPIIDCMGVPKIRTPYFVNTFKDDKVMIQLMTLMDTIFLPHPSLIQLFSCLWRIIKKHHKVLKQKPHPSLIQLNATVESGLSTKSQQNSVWTLRLDHLVGGNWLIFHSILSQFLIPWSPVPNKLIINIIGLGIRQNSTKRVRLVQLGQLDSIRSKLLKLSRQALQLE